MALAVEVRTGDAEDSDLLLSELDEVTGWLAERAADAPDNFLHLLRLLEAERAWALGAYRAAARGVDAAPREAAARRRPWQGTASAPQRSAESSAVGRRHQGVD